MDHVQIDVAPETAPATAALIGSISAWLASDAGKQQLIESFAKTCQTLDQLNKARVVAPQELHEPVTV